MNGFLKRILFETAEPAKDSASSVNVNGGEIMNSLLNSVLSWCMNTGIKILISIIIILISFRIITVVSRKIINKASKRLDKTLTKTLVYVASIVLRCIVLICIIGYLGIDTSGLSALVASLGVTFGLAVNGALGNIAGGVLILITRPFRVDDFVEITGTSGVVEDIHLTMTKIRTGDNKIVYIPNGTVATSTVINYSMKDTRRVDLNFTVGYGSDFEKAKNVVMEIMKSHELVLNDPEPMVRVSGHKESGIELVSRAWCKNGDYWTVYFDLLEQVKTEFDKNGIEIPYNQLDVHVKKDN